MKKIIKVFGKILLIALLTALFLLLFMTLSEYRPKETEPAVSGKYEAVDQYDGGDLTILSFNIGYAGLDASQDFFMDGGTGVMPQSAGAVEENLHGIAEILKSEAADVYFLQEIDKNSKRTFGIEQTEFLEDALQLYSCFAYNYKCVYVPYPWPALGKMESGIMSLFPFASEKDERIALPKSASWPLSAFYLKRCLLVSYIPIENSDKYLVLCNLHLEAYDDGEAKKAQTEALFAFLEAEYEKGNYVVAGGDFNQTFEDALESFPLLDENLWQPEILSEDILPEGWQFAFDSSAASCRLLNKPLSDDGDTQFYIIDGFILSPNVELKSVQTVDKGFLYADHNPVRLQISLRR